MAKEFHYFNFNTIAESIRYLLHYTNQKFDDVRLDFHTWPNEKIKSTLAYGQLPLYKEGERSLNQSLAIAKYVARGTDLIPDDPWEQAVLENIVYTIYDYWSNIKAYGFERDLSKKYELKRNILDNTIDYYFSRFEQHLKDHGGFFIGKLSWAEFVLCGLVEASELFLGIELAKNYPAVEAAVEIIRNLPGVKEYIATRGPYKLPFPTKMYNGLEVLDN